MIKRFIKCMLTDCPDVSSKRVVGVVSFIIIILMAMIDLFTKLKPTEFIFNGFLFITLGCFGLNAVIDIFKKPVTPVQ